MHPHHVRRAVRGFVAAALAAVAVLLLPAAPAAAHNSLGRASPAEDARLDTPPAEIRLEFLQKLDPTFTTIVLSDGARQRVPTGTPVVVGARATLPVTERLPKGTYTVAYRVVSTDGHPVQGSYAFTVADPAAPTATATAATSSPSAPAASSGDQDGGTPLVPVLVAGGALVILVAGAVALLRRRGSTR